MPSGFRVMMRVCCGYVASRLKGRDLGRVGEIEFVDPSAITSVTQQGLIPVIAPIGVDEKGLSYNVNADEAAGAIARALGAEKLILLTDVEGVKNEQGELIADLRAKDCG